MVLLTASVVLGVVGTVRYSAPRWPRFAIDSLHRDISLLVIVLLVVHIVTSVLDGFAPIKLTDAVIPFATPYRPLWMGLGALSFDLLIALVITSLMRRRLGYKSWRATHWLAYASWPIASLHGVGTGTDVKSWWLLASLATIRGTRVCARRPWRCRSPPRSRSRSSRSPGRSNMGGRGGRGPLPACFRTRSSPRFGRLPRPRRL